MTRAERARLVEDHYEKAVRELVDAHARLKNEPLVLAVRFRRDAGLDVHLLEVLESFPGADTDEPFTTEFAPSETFRILGKLHLTLVSPDQLQHAISQAENHPRAKTIATQLIASIRRDGSVVFRARSPAKRAALARKLAQALEVR